MQRGLQLKGQKATKAGNNEIAKREGENLDDDDEGLVEVEEETNRGMNGGALGGAAATRMML